MAWSLYALLCAFCLSTTDALCKKALQDTDELVVAWVRVGFSLPFLFFAVLPIKIPYLDRTFWHSLLVLLPLEITAILLYIRAIKTSPLSLTVPFLSLTPVFLIITSYLILGEFPDRSGLAGIIFIAIGAYLLNFHQGKEGILGPFQSIFKEKGSIIMVGVAFIYSITSNFGKVAILHSNPLFFGTFYTFLLTLFLLPFVLLRIIKQRVKLRFQIKTFP